MEAVTITRLDLLINGPLLQIIDTPKIRKLLSKILKVKVGLAKDATTITLVSETTVTSALRLNHSHTNRTIWVNLNQFKIKHGANSRLQCKIITLKWQMGGD